MMPLRWSAKLKYLSALSGTSSWPSKADGYSLSTGLCNLANVH
jgi:hypothetical protein